jgi:hypothetical protein
MKSARIGLSGRHPMPSPVALVTATVLAVAASLVADVLIVSAGTRVFPSTVGYGHFRFSDYGTLTVVGVVVACAAWPLVIRVSTAPRWLFFRLAVVVTLVLWLPDLVLLVRHQPVRAVSVLLVMHLAIAVLTYNLLVRMAPARPDAPASPGVDPPATAPELSLVESAGPDRLDREGIAVETDRGAGDFDRRLASALALLVGVEFVMGIATLASVPTGRASGWIPTDGTVIYLVHAVVGVPLVIGAVLFLVHVGGSTRINALSAWIGGVGVAVAGAGGVLSVAHPVRLVGLALMFVGSVAAGFGYLLPAFDRLSDDATSPGAD